jgi:hypothetical protein
MSMVKAAFAANAGTITSASTLTLASLSTGDYILLTPSGGSSSITSFGTATEGLSKRMEALGTITLRNSANLLLPGGSDLTISTGDVIYTRAMGSAVHKVTHRPYNGIPQALVNAASATVSSTTKLLAMTGGVQSTALVSEVAALAVSGTPYLALSAAHTISAGNRNAILDFTTAGVTCNMDTAASLSSGFTVVIANTAASGDVTLEPNAAETLDGLANRLLRPGDRVKITSTGTAWKTLSGVYSFDSGAQSISTGGAITLAHGLGVAPDLDFQVSLTNITNEANWTTGMVCPVPINGYQNAGSNCWTFQPDATNLNLRFGSTAASIYNRTTGTATNITPANWSWRVIVRKSYG